jgi:hypothetical protein
MLTPAQSDELFKELIGAETRALHFGDVSSKLQFRVRLLTALSLILSSSAAAAFTSKAAWAWLAPMLAISSAAISAYNIAFQTSKRAVDAADLHSKWNQLSVELTQLDSEQSASDAFQRFKALQSRACDLSKSATSFGADAKSMNRWQQLVHRQHGLPA